MNHLRLPVTSLVAALILAACQGPGASAPLQGTSMDIARQRMVETSIRQAGVTSEAVIASILATERHEFVPAEMRHMAYADAGVPIGDGQTISSPYIVAYMTEALDPQPTDRVLEIGTGSGYQAAVLSPLVRDVYSIEIVEPLGRRAAALLERLGYGNVHTRVGDGYLGWPERAPFHKIIVTCSPEEVPEPLVEQLAEGGVLIIPTGERHQQQLCRMVKRGGELVSTPLCPTLFVPMTGSAEERRRVLADGGSPELLNGDFEEGLDSGGNVEGWYYQRRLELIESEEAPSGRRFIRLKADDAGQPAHLMQGLAIDGSKVPRVDFRASIHWSSATPDALPEEAPVAGVTFYDVNRRPLDTILLRPDPDSREWQALARTGIPVPEATQEAIVRLGLFGAKGDVAFDDVALQR